MPKHCLHTYEHGFTIIAHRQLLEISLTTSPYMIYALLVITKLVMCGYHYYIYGNNHLEIIIIIIPV